MLTLAASRRIARFEKSVHDVNSAEVWYHRAQQHGDGAWEGTGDLRSAVLYNRGICLQVLGRLADSEAVLREYLATQREAHGEQSLAYVTGRSCRSDGHAAV